MIEKHFAKRITGLLLAVFMCALCAACAAGETANDAPPFEALESSAMPETNVIIDDGPIPMSDSPAANVLKPEASGTDVDGRGGATVDYSNCDEGYIMAKFSGGGKIKLRLTKSGGKTYTYDLRSDGTYEVFPLTAGDGSYTVEVFENVSGTQYAQVMSTGVNVKLRDSKLPFLYPSQYVNFNAQSKTVAKCAELAKDADDQLTVVSGVYNYVIKNISYDKQKAETVKPGYLPAVDKILASRKGICFDYAAVMAAMLRSQGIPTRLEVGYVSGGAYHAWISVYITDVGWVNNLISFDGKNWKMMDPTFASSANQSSSVMKFIGNGKNYSTQYYY